MDFTVSYFWPEQQESQQKKNKYVNKCKFRSKKKKVNKSLN